MTVLMGRQMESVVVRTMAVAKQCVAYLREKRYDPMEFVPLDSVKVRSNLMQCVSRRCFSLGRRRTVLDAKEVQVTHNAWRNWANQFPM